MPQTETWHPLEILDYIHNHPKLIFVDDYEVVLQTHRSIQKVTKKNNMIQHEERDVSWISLRLIHLKQPGKAYHMGIIAKTGGKKIESLETLIEEAFQSSKTSTVNPWFRFPFVSLRLNDYKNTYKKSENFFSRNQQGFGQKNNEENVFFPVEKNNSFELRTTIRLSEEEIFYSRKAHRSAVGWTLGDYLWHKKNILAKEWLYMLNFLTKDATTVVNQLSRGAGTSSCNAEDWDALCYQEKKLEDINIWYHKHTNLKLPKKKIPAVFTQNATEKIFHTIESWFNPYYVQNNFSPLSPYIAKPFFSSRLTLEDKGRESLSPHYSPFDLEASQSQNVVLISKGEVSAIYYDIESGAVENKLSTGNVQRDPEELLPQIKPRCWSLVGGDKNLAQLEEEIKYGVSIFYFDILHSGIEPHPMEILKTPRKIKVLCQGWYIIQGERAGSFYDLVLEFALPDIFKNVISIGNDPYFCEHYALPSVSFEGLSLV